MLNSYQLLTNSKKLFPENNALIFEEKVYSYDELFAEVEQLSLALVGLGLTAGDRIAVYIEDCPELIFSFFASSKLGMPVVALRYFLTAFEVAKQVNFTEPKVLLCDAKSYKRLQESIDNMPSLQHVIVVGEEDIQQENRYEYKHLVTIQELENKSFPTREWVPNEDAIIHFSSGSTGMPKAVIHQQKDLINSAINNSDALKLTSNDKILVCLSLANAFSYCFLMLPAFLKGASLYINRQFSPEIAMHHISSNKITVSCGLPTTIYDIMRYIDSSGLKFKHSLRCFVIGGDKVPVNIHKMFKQTFGLPIHELLGCVEGWICSMNPLDGDVKVGSVGKPIAGVSFKVVDSKNNEQTRNRPGELMVKTQTLMQKYLKNPELTKKMLSDGWYRMGDRGYIDEEGYVWIEGRMKHLIVHKALKLAPQEIEEPLYHNPLVFEAAAVGIEVDEDPDHYIVLFVTPKVSAKKLLTDRLIYDYLKTRVANYKIPHRIILEDNLPRNGGKINRGKLKQMLIEGKFGSLDNLIQTNDGRMIEGRLVC